jgi:flagellar hook protein FlgE
MIPSMAYALNGMQSAQTGLQTSAAEIVRDGLPGVESTRGTLVALVDQSEQVRQFETSVNVLKASDDMLGTLLDVKA